MNSRSFYLSFGLAAAAFSASAYLFDRSLRDEAVLIPQVDEVSRPTRQLEAKRSVPRSSQAPTRQVASVPRPFEKASVEIQKLADEVKRLQECYAGECNYPRTYPRDYDFAVGRDLKKTIYALQALVERDALVDSELARMARENLSNEDGHVKEAALHLLATQPPSEENLRSLLNDVIMENDASLIEHAMLELQRYKNPDDLKLIRESLAQAMLTGAPFVSEAVSKYIVGFIDNESYGYFSEIATRSSPGSRVKLNLQFSLTEYRRRLAGA